MFGVQIVFENPKPEGKRASAKEQFTHHLTVEKIKNERHFQDYLTESSEIAILVAKLYPITIEQVYFSNK